MAGQIAAYNLGKLGVVVDKSAIHSEDGELLSAQNAIQDKHGLDGALTKRWGLVKYAASAAAGSIPGFIGAPLGPGPGSTTDDATVYYVANNGGTWYKTTDSFATYTAVTTLAAHKSGTLTVMWNGRLYYVSTAETVRVFDGVKDSLFFDPHSTFPTVSALAVANGRLFVGVVDGSSNTYIVELDEFGRGTQIGAALSNSYGISSIIYHQSDLFVGATKAASQFRVYRIRLSTATSTTSWTQDFESSALTGATEVGLASFKGLLYAAHNSSGATKGHVYERSTSAVYTAVDTGVAVSSDATSIFVFKSALYVAWAEYDSSAPTDVIRKSTDGTSWSTVHTIPSNFDGGEFYTTGNKLVLVMDGDFVTPGSFTTDGTTWTDFATTASALRETFGFFKASGSGASFGATSAFVLLQGSTSLQLLNAAGTLLTLTLPTGITLDSARPPRFALFDRFVVMANTPSRPLLISSDGLVYVLTPLPPNRAISLDDDGGVGGLTGDYKALQTFVILDAAGNVISESDFSPVMETAFTAATDTLDAEELNISAEDITGSKIYRTTASGDTYFPWLDHGGNTLTQTVSDDQSDASLSAVAAPTLGTCPNLSLVASWRGRLWGVDRADVDHARYSEAGRAYAWPRENDILVGREGADLRGITAIIPRRDALGFGRRDSLTQITGTSANDFRSVTLSENIGVESQETVKVWKDIAYFLSKDGVYTWSSEGIKCISDGRVRAWFTTDTYFNRSRFQYAFATIDPLTNKYRLYLAPAGGSTETRWVEYDINEGTWWGPHKTDAFTPTAADGTIDTSNQPIALVGSSDGYLWKDQETRTDSTSTGIAFSVASKQHDGGTPKIRKMFERLRVLLQAVSTGRMTVTPYVGELDAAAATQALQADLTRANQSLGRVGVGEVAKLVFEESTAGQNVKLLGYELPFHELGER